MGPFPRFGARAAAAAVLVALVLPATSLAAAALPTLSAAGGAVKHYAVSLAAGSTGASLTLSRGARGSVQSHTLSTSGTGSLRYKVGKKLSSAKLSAKWGARGKVAMTFKATGRARKILPTGCKGTPAVVRNGVLVGRLTAKMDDGFFKTVKRTRMKASLTKPGKFTCKNAFSGHLSILSASKAGALSVTFLRAGAKGFVSINATVTETDAAGKWTLSHSIFEIAPASALTIAADASTATGKADGAFLRGTLTFQATGVHPSAFAIGTPGGDFVANFDSIGAQRLAPGSGANVNQT